MDSTEATKIAYIIDHVPAADRPWVEQFLAARKPKRGRPVRTTAREARVRALMWLFKMRVDRGARVKNPAADALYIQRTFGLDGNVATNLVAGKGYSADRTEATARLEGGDGLSVSYDHAQAQAHKNRRFK